MLLFTILQLLSFIPISEPALQLAEVTKTNIAEYTSLQNAFLRYHRRLKRLRRE